MPPRVSVIIPVRNCAAYLGEALDSIWRQPGPTPEVICVDDGSTDGTRDLIEREKRIRFFKTNPEGLGPGSARNLAISHASGDVFAFLDGDDIWPIDKLPTQIDALKHNPDAEVIGGLTERFITPGYQPNQPPFPANSAVYFNHHLGAFLIRRSAWERVGPFDPELRCSEDQDWNYVRERIHRFRALLPDWGLRPLWQDRWRFLQQHWELEQAWQVPAVVVQRVLRNTWYRVRG